MVVLRATAVAGHLDEVVPAAREQVQSGHEDDGRPRPAAAVEPDRDGGPRRQRGALWSGYPRTGGGADDVVGCAPGARAVVELGADRGEHALGECAGAHHHDVARGGRVGGDTHRVTVVTAPEQDAGAGVGYRAAVVPDAAALRRHRDRVDEHHRRTRRRASVGPDDDEVQHGAPPAGHEERRTAGARQVRENADEHEHTRGTDEARAGDGEGHGPSEPPPTRRRERRTPAGERASGSGSCAGASGRRGAADRHCTRKNCSPMSTRAPRSTRYRRPGSQRRIVPSMCRTTVPLPENRSATHRSSPSRPSSRCVFDTDFPGSCTVRSSSKRSPGCGRGRRPSRPVPCTALRSPVLKCSTNGAVLVFRSTMRVSSTSSAPDPSSALEGTAAEATAGSTGPVAPGTGGSGAAVGTGGTPSRGGTETEAVGTVGEAGAGGTVTGAPGTASGAACAPRVRRGVLGVSSSAADPDVSGAGASVRGSGRSSEGGSLGCTSSEVSACSGSEGASATSEDTSTCSEDPSAGSDRDSGSASSTGRCSAAQSGRASGSGTTGPVKAAVTVGRTAPHSAQKMSSGSSVCPQTGQVAGPLLGVTSGVGVRRSTSGSTTAVSPGCGPSSSRGSSATGGSGAAEPRPTHHDGRDGAGGCGAAGAQTGAAARSSAPARSASASVSSAAVAPAPGVCAACARATVPSAGRVSSATGYAAGSSGGSASGATPCVGVGAGGAAGRSSGRGAGCRSSPVNQARVAGSRVASGSQASVAGSGCRPCWSG
ncbi:hypothetical protein Cus16_0190 [Curtobacterium sp. ER1/6]|nr:hypothetical protein Cus16_0190 [Curtobacterium sp. ER1/6]